MVSERNGLTTQIGSDVRGKAGWEAPHKSLISFVDEPVLIPQSIRIRDTHADVIVRLEDLLSRFQHPGHRGKPYSVQVLDSGDAGFEHLKSGIQRIEIRVNTPRRHAAGEPELEWIVRRPKLEGRETHMMVAIDQARHDHVVGRTKSLIGLILLRQRRVWTNGQDSAITLDHSTVLDHVGCGATMDFTDDVLTADQRQGHRVLLTQRSVLLPTGWPWT